MFCNSCGKQNLMDLAYCQNCGNEMKANNLPASEINLMEEKLAYCQSCGSKIEEKYCRECGNQGYSTEIGVRTGIGGLIKGLSKEKGPNTSGPMDNIINIGSEKFEEMKNLVGKNDKKDKKGKIPKGAKIGGILVIVLLLGFLGRDMILYAVSPKAYTMSAMNKTYKSISKDFKAMKNIVVGNLSSKDASTNKIKLMVERASHSNEWYNMGLQMINNVGLEIETSNDPGKKELQVSGKAFYGGRDLLSTGIVLNNDEFVINLPELYHRPFVLPSKDFGRKWNQSELAYEEGTYLDDSLDISYSELTNTIDIGKMDNKTKKAYANAFLTMTKNADVKKSGKDSLYLDGKEKKFTKTTYTLKENDLKAGLLELINAAQEDNRIFEIKEDLRKTGGDLAVRELDDFLRELSFEVNNYFTLDSIVVDLYSDGGLILGMDLSITPDNSYPDNSLMINLGLYGKNSPIDDMKLEIKVGKHEEAHLIMNLKGNHTGKGKKYESKLDIRAREYGYDLFKIEGNTSIDLSKSEDNLDIYLRAMVDGDQNAININIRGDYSSTSKELYYNFKDTTVEVMDYGDKLSIYGSLELGLENSSSKLVNINENDKLKVLEMNAYDLMELAFTMSSKFSNITSFLDIF